MPLRPPSALTLAREICGAVAPQASDETIALVASLIRGAVRMDEEAVEREREEFAPLRSVK